MIHNVVHIGYQGTFMMISLGSLLLRTEIEVSISDSGVECLGAPFIFLSIFFLLLSRSSILQ